jgi:hypothetical protein
VDRHIAEGEKHLAEQQRRIELLRRDGHNTAQSEQLLAVLRESQATHLQTRERIRQEIGKSAADEVARADLAPGNTMLPSGHG